MKYYVIREVIRMQPVTIRAPKKIVYAIDTVLDPLTGETRSDFMRIAAIERLEKLGIDVRK